MGPLLIKPAGMMLFYTGADREKPVYRYKAVFKITEYVKMRPQDAVKNVRPCGHMLP
jgi:hypothetical protein